MADVDTLLCSLLEFHVTSWWSAAKPTSSDPLRQSEVLEHNVALLATSSTTSTNRRSQQQRPSSSWAVWASDSLSSIMGSSAVDLGQASLYAAVGLSGCTLIYCVVAERRAIRRWVKVEHYNILICLWKTAWHGHPSPLTAYFVVEMNTIVVISSVKHASDGTGTQVPTVDIVLMVCC